MAASASAQIVTEGGKTMRTKLDGRDIPDYVTVQGILIGAVMIWLLFFLLLGPEADGAHFDQAPTAMAEGGGTTHPADFVRRDDGDDTESAEKHVLGPMGPYNPDLGPYQNSGMGGVYNGGVYSGGPYNSHQYNGDNIFDERFSGHSSHMQHRSS